MRGGKYNRVLYWPTVVAVFWCLWLVRTDDLIGGLLGFAAWVVFATISVGTCIIALAEREWRRAISASILPLSLIVFVLNYGVLTRFADHLHFRMHNCDYSDPPCY